MTFNLKEKIINLSDGPLKYLAEKKKCPTRPPSSLVYIKPGRTNAPIREKIILFAGLHGIPQLMINSCHFV